MNADDAIKLAMEEIKKLFGGTGHRLEEIEYHPEGDYDVTVSFRSPDGPPPSSLSSGSFVESLGGRRAAIGVDGSRTYKDVRVSKDGLIKSVRMRQIVVG